jgi:hypothetical protein
MYNLCDQIQDFEAYFLLLGVLADQRQLQFPTTTITNPHRPQLIFLVAIPRSGVNLHGDCRGPTRARRQLQFPTDAC